MGSVVKQCLDDQPEEDDDEDDGSDGVFGVTTVLNITKRKVSKNLISDYLYMVNRPVLYIINKVVVIQGRTGRRKGYFRH